MKHTLNRAKKLNKTCEITTCVLRDWPPCIRRLNKLDHHRNLRTRLRCQCGISFGSELVLIIKDAFNNRQNSKVRPTTHCNTNSVLATLTLIKTTACTCICGNGKTYMYMGGSRGGRGPDLPPPSLKTLNGFLAILVRIP